MKDHGERDYPGAVFMRLEGEARVGWARYYAEHAEVEHLRALNSVLTERIDTLICEVLTLVDDVLHARNLRAFGRAYAVQELIDDYDRGRGRDG